MRKLLSGVILIALSQQAAAVSNTFTYQGSLVDGGQPANGTYDLRFELSGAIAGPISPILIREDVPVSSGVFTVELDFGSAITGADFSLIVGVRPGASSGAYTVLNPSTPIRPTPQAQVAGLATEAVTVSPNAIGSASIQDGSVSGADINSAQVQARVTGVCAAGSAIKAIAANGSVSCEAAAAAVTSVATGAGLTGGPITSSGTISVAESGIEGSMIEDGAVGASKIIDTEVQRRVSGNCAPGSAIREIGTDGSVSCDTAALGAFWSTTGNAGTGASNFLGTTDAQPLSLRVQNISALRLEPSGLPWSVGPNTINVIMGSRQNSATTGVRGASVLGGGAEPGSEGVPFTGQPNHAYDHYALVAGGYENNAGSNNASLDDASFATVLGGSGNSATHEHATVVGGLRSTASGVRSIVAGGQFNRSEGGTSIVAGGYFNHAASSGAAVVGGESNCAGGLNSFAGGRSAHVRPATGTTGNCGQGVDSGDANGDEGTFNWADSSTFSAFASTGPNQFLVRADGGVLLNTTSRVSNNDDLVLKARALSGDADADLRMVTRNNKSALIFLRDLDGAITVQLPNLTAGTDRLVVGGGAGGNATLSNGGTWTNASSRAFKTGFAAIDPLDVLNRVANLPISRWVYTGSEEGTHMGPMAEDFKAAFDLAGNGKSIATVDADGVALAAIQGLNQKLESENAALRAESAALRQRLDAIEARLQGR